MQWSHSEFSHLAQFCEYNQLDAYTTELVFSCLSVSLLKTGAPNSIHFLVRAGDLYAQLVDH